MNTPNPLIPQGSLQQRQSKGKSTFFIAVFTVIAIHAVFFTGLLMQGCKPEGDKDKKLGAASTNATDQLAKLDPSYLASPNDLPKPATNLPGASEFAQTNLPQQTTYQPPVVTNPIVQTATIEQQVETKEYTVVRNDNLYKIAKANGVTAGAITKANPDLDPLHLKPGQKLQIPKAATPVATLPASNGTASEKTAPATGSQSTYVVKAGDSLTRIATQHKTTVKAIKAANNLKTDRVTVGQKLKVPTSSASGSGVREHASASTPTNAQRLPGAPLTLPGATNR
jgi:LysM repeat protein